MLPEEPRALEDEGPLAAARAASARHATAICRQLDAILLRDDQRGMLRLRPLLARDAWEQAARALLAHGARVLVLTGFTIDGQAETDGPPGAIAIAQAIVQLGGQATLVSDGPTCAVLHRLDELHLTSPRALPPWCEMAVQHGSAARLQARDLLSQLRPTAIISIERCGPAADGRYRTMRGIDITTQTAPLDLLLTEADADIVTLGIGDGGNEIGLGTLASGCLALGVTPHPCIVPAHHPLLAAVSTWGGWGLVAALSCLAGKTLLPTEEETRGLLGNLVAAGCIDGISGLRAPTIDGFDLEDNLQRLRELHDLLNDQLSNGPS